MQALSLVPLSVGEFLDASDLCRCELAKLFSTSVMEWLWTKAAAVMVEDTPVWGAWKKCTCTPTNPFLERGLEGKKLIAEMTLARRAFHICGYSQSLKRWNPWVVQTSASSFKAQPRPDDGPENYNEDMGRPDRVSLALPLGTNWGQSLVLGIKLVANGPVGDNLSVGIESLTDSYGWISISFAPFAGSCFFEFAGHILQSDAICGMSEACDGTKEVDVWAQVTSTGGIRFLRQCKCGELQEAAYVPPEHLPACTMSFFASFDIWVGDLEGMVDVSVVHAGRSFPRSMSIKNEQEGKLVTHWTPVTGDWEPEMLQTLG